MRGVKGKFLIAPLKSRMRLHFLVPPSLSGQWPPWTLGLGEKPYVGDDREIQCKQPGAPTLRSHPHQPWITCFVTGRRNKLITWLSLMCLGHGSVAQQVTLPPRFFPPCCASCFSEVDSRLQEGLAEGRVLGLGSASPHPPRSSSLPGAQGQLSARLLLERTFLASARSFGRPAGLYCRQRKQG